MFFFLLEEKEERKKYKDFTATIVCNLLHLVVVVVDYYCYDFVYYFDVDFVEQYSF